MRKKLRIYIYPVDPYCNPNQRRPRGKTRVHFDRHTWKECGMREFTNRNMNCSCQGCIQYHRSFISRRQNNTSAMLHSWLAVAGALGFILCPIPTISLQKSLILWCVLTFPSPIEWSCTLFTNLGFPTPMIAMFDSFQLIHGYSLRHSLQARRCVSKFAGPNSPIGVTWWSGTSTTEQYYHRCGLLHWQRSLQC